MDKKTAWKTRRAVIYGAYCLMIALITLLAYLYLRSNPAAATNRSDFFYRMFRYCLIIFAVTVPFLSIIGFISGLQGMHRHQGKLKYRIFGIASCGLFAALTVYMICCIAVPLLTDYKHVLKLDLVSLLMEWLL